MKKTVTILLSVILMISMITTVFAAEKEYGSWSSWTDAPIQASETLEVETRQKEVPQYKTVWIYDGWTNGYNYHFCGNLANSQYSGMRYFKIQLDYRLTQKDGYVWVHQAGCSCPHSGNGSGFYGPDGYYWVYNERSESVYSHSEYVTQYRSRTVTIKQEPVAQVHVHQWEAVTEDAHPHAMLQKCRSCGETEVLKKSVPMDGCKICNPVIEEHIHDWKTDIFDKHPHKSLRYCDCGKSETVKNSNYAADCEICNPPKEEPEDMDESEYWDMDEYESDDSAYEDSYYEDSYYDDYYADEYEDPYYDEYYTDEYEDPYFDGYYTDDYDFTEDFYEDTTGYLEKNYSYNSAVISVGIGQNYIRKQETILYMDAPAYINAAGYTMVPLRAIAECLDGTEVEWDNNVKVASVYRQNGDVIKMSATLNFIQVNEGGFWGKTKPEVKNGRIFIPMRDLAAAFGLSSDAIEWDAAAKTATFYF